MNRKLAIFAFKFAKFSKTSMRLILGSARPANWAGLIATIGSNDETSVPQALSDPNGQSGEDALCWGRSLAMGRKSASKPLLRAEICEH
jgi:hypothetical protein